MYVCASNLHYQKSNGQDSNDRNTNFIELAGNFIFFSFCLFFLLCFSLSLFGFFFRFFCSFFFGFCCFLRFFFCFFCFLCLLFFCLFLFRQLRFFRSFLFFLFLCFSFFLGNLIVDYITKDTLKQSFLICWLLFRMFLRCRNI